MSKLDEDTKREILFKQASSISSYFKNWAEFKDKGAALYYIHFFNDDISFWKIGITHNDIHGRFGSVELFEHKHDLKYEIIFTKNFKFKDALAKEQKILKKYKEDRIIIDYNNFKTTEAFSRDIFEGGIDESI